MNDLERNGMNDPLEENNQTPSVGEDQNPAASAGPNEDNQPYYYQPPAGTP